MRLSASTRRPFAVLISISAVLLVLGSFDATTTDEVRISSLISVRSVHVILFVVLVQLEAASSTIQQPGEMEINPFWYAGPEGTGHRVYGGGQKGFGPYYYGDTKVYGAQLDAAGRPQPFPMYFNVHIDQKAG